MPTSGPEYVSHVLLKVWEYRKKRPVDRILDIGPGFGKYGLLCREFFGYWWQRDDPRLPPDCQRLTVDAVEAESRYSWPLFKAFYDEVYIARIQDVVDELHEYDVALMIDVIEHLPDADGERVIAALRRKCKLLVVVTPETFYAQHVEGSPTEDHVSFWPRERLTALGADEVEQVDEHGQPNTRGAICAVWRGE